MFTCHQLNVDFLFHNCQIYFTATGRKAQNSKLKDSICNYNKCNILISWIEILWWQWMVVYHNLSFKENSNKRTTENEIKIVKISITENYKKQDLSIDLQMRLEPLNPISPHQLKCCSFLLFSKTHIISSRYMHSRNLPISCVSVFLNIPWRRDSNNLDLWHYGAQAPIRCTLAHG